MESSYGLKLKKNDILLWQSGEPKNWPSDHDISKNEEDIGTSYGKSYSQDSLATTFLGS